MQSWVQDGVTVVSNSSLLFFHNHRKQEVHMKVKVSERSCGESTKKLNNNIQVILYVYIVKLILELDAALL